MRLGPIARFNLLSTKGVEPMDIVLHEMACVAHSLSDIGHGHGHTWGRWARHAGCRRETKGDRPGVRSRRHTEPVTRVSSLPLALRRRAA